MNNVVKHFLHFAKENGVYLFFINRINNPEYYRKRLIERGINAYKRIFYINGIDGFSDRVGKAHKPEVDILCSRLILPFEFDELPCTYRELETKWRNYKRRNNFS